MANASSEETTPQGAHMRSSARSELRNNARHGRRTLPAPAGGAKTAIRTSPEHRLLSDPLSDACDLSDGPSARQNALRCCSDRQSSAQEEVGRSLLLWQV